MRKAYLEFVEKRAKEPKNSGKSFTMWCALYDFCHWWNRGLETLWIEPEVNEIIVSQSGANYERVEGLNDDAKLEILDISILDELWRQIEEEEMEREKEECFDSLDSYLFVNRDEILWAIQDFFYPSDSEEWSPSYWELSMYEERADEYAEDNDYEFDEEWNIIR